MFLEDIVSALDLTDFFCYCVNFSFILIALLGKGIGYLLIKVQQITNYYSSLLVRKLHTANQSYGIK